jgi:hypothetical protein
VLVKDVVVHQKDISFTVVPIDTPSSLTMRLRNKQGHLLLTRPVPIGASTISIPHSILKTTKTLEVFPKDTNVPPTLAGMALLPSTANVLDVGILMDSTTTDGLLHETHYIRTALQDKTTVYTGTLQDVLSKKVGFIIVPDAWVLDKPSIDTLTTFMDGGGVVLRLGGLRLSKHPDTLLPVTLRYGIRQRTNQLAGQNTLYVHNPEDSSPLTGLVFQPPIAVKGSLLANPIGLHEDTVWLRLSDNSPLLTHKAVGNGHLLLLHTSLTPDWSDLAWHEALPLLFDRLLKIGTAPLITKQTTLGTPKYLLEADGTLTPSPFWQKPLEATSLQPLSSSYPTGLYGHDETPRNAGDNLGDISPIKALLPNHPILPSFHQEIDLMVYSFLGALAMVLLDGLLLLSRRRIS